jgi:DNA replication and repair protein RecF
MWVKSLYINNLRNIKSANIELEPGLNCFIGGNGAGKTTVLEALSMLSKGRSFRAGQVASLIGPEQSHFQVAGQVELCNGDAHRLGMERGGDYWKARHNGQDVAQLSELTEHLPFVILAPSSHTLVSGPPDGRRKYLDWGVFHVEHEHLVVWRRYARVLKQRNAALRQKSIPMIESLDPQLVLLGEQLHQARRQHAERLNEMLAEKLVLFNQELDGMVLNYRKGWSTERLNEALELSRERDLERGVTGPGPHKADLLLSVNGANAKERLSRGEQKAMTAALIMAQAQMISELGEKPVLLLDDLASELDEDHLFKVLNAGLSLGVQLWLTGTDLVPVIDACGTPYKVFHVEHGKLLAVGN